MPDDAPGWNSDRRHVWFHIQGFGRGCNGGAQELTVLLTAARYAAAAAL
jgi:hypothetical protein